MLLAMTTEHFPIRSLSAHQLGKSNLVKILANELQVELHETLAQTLVQATDLSALLLETESRQILFIDEADEMPAEQQTLLYRALAEGKLFLPRRRSSTAPSCLPLDKFTLIMASNHESRLARPLVERFKIVCRFDFYSDSEIHQILEDRAAALGWVCTDDVLRLVAERSRGVPRIALRLLESVHRTARSENANALSWSHFERMCAIEGIDHRGLNRAERQYLRILHEQGSPVRLNVIADRLGLPARTVSSVIESFLVREQFVSRCDEGRQLTADGDRHLLDGTRAQILQ